MYQIRFWYQNGKNFFSYSPNKLFRTRNAAERHVTSIWRAIKAPGDILDRFTINYLEIIE